MANNSVTKTKSYYYAIGRRKTSTAIVKLYPKWKGNRSVITETKKHKIEDFFGGHNYLIEDALYPFTVLGKDISKNYDLEVKVRWGWLRWQAQAIRLWLSRALVESDPECRTSLKPYGFLKRDPRIKERKKPWRLKARKKPEWSKR